MESLYYFFFDCHQYVASLLIDAIFCVIIINFFDTAEDQTAYGQYDTLSLCLFAYMYKCIMISVVYKYLHFTLMKFWTPTA